MLPLNQEQRKDIKPDMTIKEIREYKKSLKEKDTYSTVASTQPEFVPFDINKYQNTHIKEIREELVKNCSAVNDNVVFDVFDRDGNFLYGNVVCDLIYAKNGSYYFRLWQSGDKKE